jgi:acetate---CoA ligase (ADP-forming)
VTAPVPRPALEAMLEARSVAVVGASARPASFGRRLVDEITKSRSLPEIHLVNPGYSEIDGRPCVASLDDIPGPVDLVLLGVPDSALETEMAKAVERGDRSAVIFGSAFEPVGQPLSDGIALRTRLSVMAKDAEMALCGAGCMGFVNISYGLRAIGYVEPDPIPSGPLALVSCSGSAFSAMLRTSRPFGWTIAVSSGQELVTSAASYIEYALGLEQTKVIALLLETIHQPPALDRALARAAENGVVVVALTVGRSERGQAMVAAHSGALAGSDAAWEALFDRHAVIRVGDLDEMTDTLELFCSRRRPEPRPAKGGGVAAVYDSGGERALAVDLAGDLSLRFASISKQTEARLIEFLDPGLAPCNPLDLWGTGSDTADRFGGALVALAEDPETDVVALSVDLVYEYDDDDSYERALIEAHAATAKPVALLSNIRCAIDPAAAGRLRAAGIPVLEGTRTGMLAMRHLLEWRDATSRPVAESHQMDQERAERWSERLKVGPLSGTESLALVSEYGIPVTRTARVESRDELLALAKEIGFPVVMKTDMPGIEHKSDVGGVVVGLGSQAEVSGAYDDMARRLGPEVLLAETAPPGVEIALGMVRDQALGPIVVVGAGGLLVEVIGDRRVGLPPIGIAHARRMLEGLGVRAMLDGVRGSERCDIEALARAIVSVSVLATELGPGLNALDVNPLRCGPTGVVALDALVIASDSEELTPNSLSQRKTVQTQKIT